MRCFPWRVGGVETPKHPCAKGVAPQYLCFSDSGLGWVGKMECVLPKGMENGETMNEIMKCPNERMWNVLGKRRGVVNC